jgi:periplasmic divalent cation tolerance protein
MAAIVVLSTAPKVEEAEKIAQTLVQERLAACVNLLPQIDSRYWWEGKIQSGQEVLMIMKTVSGRFKALKKRIHDLHSYEVPEILAVPVATGSEAYLRWMKESTTVQSSRKKSRKRK